ncbi:hypothetical protein TNCV_1896061 [Trichonephila clavipes]|nr:hypothetical protein TNCV_1896061 [Trichonephila clavipes]
MLNILSSCVSGSRPFPDGVVAVAKSSVPQPFYRHEPLRHSSLDDTENTPSRKAVARSMFRGSKTSHWRRVVAWRGRGQIKCQPQQWNNPIAIVWFLCVKLINTKLS